MKRKLLFYAHALTFALGLLFTLPGSSHAQKWQWGRRGGGFSDNGTETPQEAVTAMATDKAGNVYSLSVAIHGGTPDLEGTPLATYGDRDIVVSKFSCDGTLRWTKVIGGGSTDFPSAIGTDTLGHVYVCGKTYPDLAPYDVHFSTDTTQPAGNKKSLFLVQFDTLGNFQWLRQPDPDTASVFGTITCQSYDMKVMPNGDVYWLTKLNEGLVSAGKGWVVTARHPFILHYDVTGDMVDHITPDMESDIAAFYSMSLERMKSGNFVIAGGHAFIPGVSHFTMGGNVMEHPLFVGMFSSTGAFLWKRENTGNIDNSKVTSRPVVDDSGYIYLAGTICTRDTFNGYAHLNFHHPTFTVSSDPFLCKLDAAGNLKWMKAASGMTNNYKASVQIKNATELWLSGDYTSVWWDSTHLVQTVPNEGTHFYVTRFNTSGKVLRIDSLKGPVKPNNYFWCSTVDRKGNLYIGGEFPATLTVAGHTMSCRGGFSDFFLAKFGIPCDCTLPAADFSQSTSGRLINLSYTGTTMLADSVVWNYGNGVSATKTGTGISTPFSYTYPADGTYLVCATIYSECGSDKHCEITNITSTGIAAVPGMEAVSIYPNPALDEIRVSGIPAGTTAQILDVTGKSLTRKMVLNPGQPLALPALCGGVYLLVLTLPDNSSGTFRLIKK